MVRERVDWVTVTPGASRDASIELEGDIAAVSTSRGMPDAAESPALPTPLNMLHPFVM